ncbi:MAG TPA: redoxin domain-containing protein [Candidatus Dormibacteraeota bacterium]
MLRRHPLVLASIAAVILGVALGAALLPKAGPKGTIALMAARHGGIDGQITQVILHGSSSDVTVTPQAQPLLAAPAEAQLGTYAVAAGTYADVEVRLGARVLHRAAAVTVTANGLTPILLGFDQSGLSVYVGNDRTGLGIELLSGHLTNLPQTTFTDENGKPVPLTSLHGKVTVVAAFLTHCHESCPLFTQILADLSKVLESRGLSGKVNLVEITMDPGRDTPSVMKAYARKTGATWPLLTASDAALRTFWSALQVSYNNVPYTDTPPTDWYTGRPETYDVTHDTVAVVLDQQGYPRFTLVGNPHLGHALSQPLASFLTPDLRSAAAEQQGWSLQDLLDRADVLLGLPSEAAGTNDIGVREGNAAPGFTLTALSGSRTSLRDHLGQPVIVNFWATWCDPCRRELPLLNGAAHRLSSLSILAVDEGESAASIRPFLQQVLGRDVAITALLDTDNQVGNTYAVAGLPVSVFIDAGGIVRAVHIGELDAPTLNDELHAIGAQ